MTKPKRPKVDTNRARNTDRQTRDARVNRVIAMMVNGQWHGAKSSHELAAEFGVSFHCVHEYAREANSVIRRAFGPEDREALREQFMLGIEALKARALEKGDLRTALGTFDLVARVAGLITQKVDAQVSQGVPSADQARAQLASMQAALTMEIEPE